MKKYLTLIIILLTFTSLSFAQMQLGLKAGLNISDLVISDPEEEAANFDTKLGFVAGAYFNYQINKLFG